MQVLFITSSRIGDAVLSTGILAHIVRTYPAAEITIVCGPLAKSLFEGVPGLKDIIAVKKKKFNAHWFDVWKKTAGTTWDMVVDLRNSAVSRLVPARRRYIHSSAIEKSLHKVEQAAALMKLGTVPPPHIWFTEAQKKRAAVLVPDGGPVLGVGPTANWIGKTWPADRFSALVKFITEEGGILPGARVAVFAAPGEEAGAYAVLNTVPENRRIDVIAKGDPGTAAAALARCVLYVGNDSGLMHCAAAAGVPTFGLFGPSWPHLYRPWGPHTGYIATPENFDQLTDFPGYDPKTLNRSLMTTLTLEAAKTAIAGFWAKKSFQAQ